MPGDGLIVARGEEELYEYLKVQLDEQTTVVLDRRAGERRGRDRGHKPERRRRDRRSRHEIDADLRSLGFAGVSASG